jgi:hypothetical protein
MTKLPNNSRLGDNWGLGITKVKQKVEYIVRFGMFELTALYLSTAWAKQAGC